MARKVDVKFGGKVVSLKASFAAASDICDRVADLMFINREAGIAMMLMEKGIPYSPKWQFSVGSVLDILEIALAHSGVKAERSDIQEFAVGIGFNKAQDIATDYLQLFFSEPEEKVETGGDAPGE